MKSCIDIHVHLGRSRDGAELKVAEIRKAMEENGIARTVVFAIDEPVPGPSYEKVNKKVFKAAAGDLRLIPFARLNPRSGERAMKEFRHCLQRGARGVKLHPRSEKFSPREAEALIEEIEKERLPIILHTSHEPHCGPLAWKGIFKRHPRIPFILAHAGKDAYPEAIEVARQNRNVWLETTTLSYFRTGVILKRLGASRLVFGSDLPYSHPAIERLKFDLLLKASERRRVYSENARRILGE